MRRVPHGAEIPRYIAMQGSPDHPGSSIKNLLLLEREERPMRMLRACLEPMGYKVLTSSSPEWTKEMLEDPAIDLLIISLSPGEEGEQITELTSVLGDRPLLLVEPETGQGASVDLDMQDSPSIHHLSRPFTLDELDRKIKESIRSTRLYP